MRRARWRLSCCAAVGAGGAAASPLQMSHGRGRSRTAFCAPPGHHARALISGWIDSDDGGSGPLGGQELDLVVDEVVHHRECQLELAGCPDLLEYFGDDRLRFYGVLDRARAQGDAARKRVRIGGEERGGVLLDVGRRAGRQGRRRVVEQRLAGGFEAGSPKLDEIPVDDAYPVFVDFDRQRETQAAGEPGHRGRLRDDAQIVTVINKQPASEDVTRERRRRRGNRLTGRRRERRSLVPQREHGVGEVTERDPRAHDGRNAVAFVAQRAALAGDRPDLGARQLQRIKLHARAADPPIFEHGSGSNVGEPVLVNTVRPALPLCSANRRSE